MSDESPTPDGAVEAAAQSAGQAEQTQPVMPDGWNGEFDAPRAKATIDRLREFEGQLKKLESDPEAFQEFAQRHGYEFVTDEANDPDTSEWEPQYETPPDDPRISQMEQQLSQLQQQKEIELVASHVVELTADKGLDSDTQRYLFDLAKEPGFTPARTEKIVNGHLKALEAAKAAAIEEYRTTKRSPAPPLPGAPGEPAPDLSTPQKRADAMAAAIRANSQD